VAGSGEASVGVLETSMLPLRAGSLVEVPMILVSFASMWTVVCVGFGNVEMQSRNMNGTKP
jgi:hypothetical protein